MDRPLVWILIFFAAAVTALLLWSRMLKTLRAHDISYDRCGRLGGLIEYHRFAREGAAGDGEKRLLWWVYVTLAATWVAFIGLLVSGVAGS